MGDSDVGRECASGRRYQAFEKYGELVIIKTVVWMAILLGSINALETEY